MKNSQLPSIELKHNNCAANDPCALCGRRTDPTVGLELFLEGTYELVCRRCAGKIDPAKVRWRDWAEAATAQAAGRAGASPAGGCTLDFRKLGPIEEPLRCPVCDGDEVQLACLICLMPNRQIAYLDHLGMRVYASNVPDGFLPGATMVFRCAGDHLLFRHFNAAGHRTHETRLAAHAGPGVLAELQPLWERISREDSGIQDKRSVGE